MSLTLKYRYTTVQFWNDRSIWELSVGGKCDRLDLSISAQRGQVKDSYFFYRVEGDGAIGAWGWAIEMTLH